MIRTFARAAFAAALIATFAAPALAHEGHDHAAEAADTTKAAAGASVTLGELTISLAFARATLPNAPVGGAYLTIVNKGQSDDRLVSAEAPVAGKVELHEMAMEGDVMKMRQLTDGVPVPAGATVELKPGGLHIMLMGLKESLVEGQTFPLTLTFEHAGTVTVDVAIGAIGAQGASDCEHAGDADAHAHPSE